MTRDDGQTELEKMLGKMSKEDFERLGKILFADAENGPEDKDDQIPVVEAEVVMED